MSAHLSQIESCFQVCQTIHFLIHKKIGAKVGKCLNSILVNRAPRSVPCHPGVGVCPRIHRNTQGMTRGKIIRKELIFSYLLQMSRT